MATHFVETPLATGVRHAANGKSQLTRGRTADGEGWIVTQTHAPKVREEQDWIELYQ